MPLSSETKGILELVSNSIYFRTLKKLQPNHGSPAMLADFRGKGGEEVVTFKRTTLCNRDYKGYLKDIFLIENEIFVFFFKISFFQR